VGGASFRKPNDDRGPAGGTTTGVPQEEPLTVRPVHQVVLPSLDRAGRPHHAQPLDTIAPGFLD
jgi:hypothetical protein